MGVSLARRAPAAQPDADRGPPCLYARWEHAGVLAHMGEPLAVPEWRGLVLARPFGTVMDAVGPYPLTVLPADADLDGGLERLKRSGLVSAVLVPDPLIGPSPERLAEAFDVCRPFKTHWLVRPGCYAPSKHHRDRIRRAHRRCRVEPVRLADRLPEWTALYAGLIAEKAVSGPAAFPAAYFAMLADAPELRAWATFIGQRLVAMTLWFEHDGIAYNHLTASSSVGRTHGAGFALYDAAIQHFMGAVINLGGGAGLADEADDGLAAFKRGFADDAVTAHLCGAVLNPVRYAALSAGKPRDFFPAYRG